MFALVTHEPMQDDVQAIAARNPQLVGDTLAARWLVMALVDQIGLSLRDQDKVAALIGLEAR